MRKSWLLLSICTLMAYAEEVDMLAFSDAEEHSAYVADEYQEDAVIQPPRKTLRKPPARRVDRRVAKKTERKAVVEEEAEAEEVQAPRKPTQRSRSAIKKLEAAAAEEELAEEEYSEEAPARTPSKQTPNPNLKQRSAVNAPGEPLKSKQRPKRILRSAKPLPPQKQLQVDADEEMDNNVDDVYEQPAQKPLLKPKHTPSSVSTAPAQMPKKQPKVSYVAKRNLAQNDDSDTSGGMNNNNNYSNQNTPAQKPMQNTWDGHRKPIYGEEAWAGIEFLWWKADENGLDFAIDKEFSVFQSSAYGNVPLDGLAGKMHNAPFSWEPGFRAQIGYRFARDAWEMFAEYAWFMTDGIKRHVAFPTSGAQPMLVGTLAQNLNATVTSAHSHLTLKTQVANIDLARRFELSRYILLRLFGGVRGAWMRQNWQVNYSASSNGAEAFNTLKWSYEGYGLHFGLSSDWYLGYGFNFFAQGAASALYGKHTDSVHTTSTLSSFPLQNAHLKDYRSIQETQLLAGLAWGDTWGQIGLKIYAAWEMDTWYNVAEHYRTNTANATDEIQNVEKVRNLTTSNLSMKGLTAGVIVEF